VRVDNQYAEAHVQYLASVMRFTNNHAARGLPAGGNRPEIVGFILSQPAEVG